LYTFDLLNKQSELRPEKVALIDAASGRESTYALLNQRASRCAEYLRDEMGVKAGEPVAILAHNSSDYIEVLYACAKIEAILVPLSWRLAPPELDFILADCRPTVLIYDAPFRETVAELGQRPEGGTISLGAGDYGATPYEQALAASSGETVVMPARDPRETWSILYTSGTTGRPKGVLQTFDMALHNMLNIGLPIDLNSSDTTLNVLPFFHTGGLNLYLNPTLIVGGTAIIQRTFEPEETLRLLAERASVFFGVPAVYLFLSQHPDFTSTDLSGVRSWTAGGAPMPVTLLQAYAKQGIRIRQGFGMTETGPTVFLIDEENALSKAGSVGKPQLYVDVRIVDGQGRDVANGEAGELLVRGPAVTKGYWELPDVTAETIRDGWLHTGDVARRDEDGYYYIVDRLKDMYISGGENVYPAEVEAVLHSHPAVVEAAVVGVPHERWGEVGKAVVVPKPGERPTEAELLEFCNRKLARYKVPNSVAFVEALPRNAAGKVSKTYLRGEDR
jgi:fatty-acyl-CoA synthase